MDDQQVPTVQKMDSAQSYVEGWMKGKSGGEWINVYIWWSPFTVHLKLSQHC